MNENIINILILLFCWLCLLKIGSKKVNKRETRFDRYLGFPELVGILGGVVIFTILWSIFQFLD